MSDRPNILWIQTDEQRTDSLGCYGSLWARTPNIDGLAERGTLFANHHVQSPLCVPSRTCELTGLYPHQTGVFSNSDEYGRGRFPPGATTFPECFAAAGYTTASYGKYHTPHHHTWLENWHFEMFEEEAWYRRLAPGLDEKEHRIIRRGNDPKGLFLAGIYPAVAGGRTPTSHVVDTAIDWLRGIRTFRRPFLLRVSFLAPHTPVLAPEPFFSMYDRDEMPWDAPSEEVLASRPAFELTGAELAAFRAHTPDQLRGIRTAYYGLASHVDDQIGRLLRELERLDLRAGTIIVFSSDHGNLLGEYGQFQKGKFYDIVTRVPCIISAPGLPSGRVDGLTESIDLGPTLLALAGLPIPTQLHGTPMTAPNAGRESVIGEIISGGVRRSWIRTKKWSLDVTTAIDGRPTAARDGKLIDLEDDPLAHRNLYGDPRHAAVVQELERLLDGRTAQERPA